MNRVSSEPMIASSRNLKDDLRRAIEIVEMAEIGAASAMMAINPFRFVA
jgi:hypothetical protein